jgi:hypothetical protein
MNRWYLLLLIGVVLCGLGVRAVDLLRKLVDSLSLLAKDRQSALERETIGIMTATLIAGTLANPGYQDGLRALREDLSEAERATREFRETHAEVGADLDTSALDDLQKHCQTAIRRADVFCSEGREKLIELARETYNAARPS